MSPTLPRTTAASVLLSLCALAQREFVSRSPRAIASDADQRVAARSFPPTPSTPPRPPATRAAIAAPRSSTANNSLERVDERVRFCDVDGALWARGTNYKMCFERGSTRYFPFLASWAPRHFPLELTLREVTLGSRPLAFDASASATVDGSAVTLDRGALRELYELTPRTVEQEFVFDALPRRGELIVRFDVNTELSATTTDDGFEFANEYGRVLYGRARAIDAHGNELELRSTFVDGVITITVPANFVSQATLPLVIDPILASFGVEGSPVNTFSPDVTFDATGTAALYCWEEEFNANDHDVWADVYDANGNPLYHGDWIDMTATYWGRPRSANLGASNRFLIVAHSVNNATGRVEVWARTRSVTSALLSSQFKVMGNSGYDVMFPDVGGDPYPTGPSYFLVVYERVYVLGQDHDLHAKLVTDAGTLATNAFGIDTSINTYDIAASVSKSNGSNAWNVAWQRASPAGGHDVLGARVDWDGFVSAPTFPVAVGPLDHTNPAAAASAENTNLWVCAYEEDFGSDHDIIATGLDGSTIKRTLDLSSYDGAYWYQDQITPSIDCDGVHFACSYSELWGQSTYDYDVYVSEVLFNGVSLSVLEAHQPVFQTGGAEIEVQIAAIESSQPSQSSHDYAVAWHREPDGYSFASDDILGASYRGHAGGQVGSFCDGATVACPCGNGTSTSGGCPNSVNSAGALLTWSGQPSTTVDTLQFFASGMPGHTTCLFFQGANALNGTLGQPLGDGMRCAGSPMVRLSTTQASAAGAALYPASGDLVISLKGHIPPAGSTAIYQVWYRNPAAFCTTSTTNLSNALVVAWTP